MDILIQGTEGGYRFFTHEYKFKLDFRDVRPLTITGNTVGNVSYSISYANGLYIFSKYIIIRDVKADKKTGFIRFCLILTENEKLTGNNIKELLDDVSNVFCQRHIPRNDNNLEPFDEDWIFLDEIKNKYADNISYIDPEDIETLQSGQIDGAYIYYNSETELFNYFDSPIQEDYSDFYQVYLIDKRFESSDDNPLNALRHSENNLTGKIVPANEYLIRLDNHADEKTNIYIKANGKPVSKTKKVRLKTGIDITWSRKFYKSQNISDLLRNINPTYLNLDKVNKIATIRDIQLEPITHGFIIETKDINGKPLSGVNLTLTNKHGEQKLTSSPIILTEEQLQDQWYIIGKKGNMISEPLRISIGKESIVLTLIETRIVNYTVYREIVGGDLFLNNEFSIKVSDVKKLPNDGKITFVGNEIGKRHTIAVTAKGYETETFDYIPDQDQSNDLRVALIKIKSYNIDAGDHGVKTTICPKLSQHSKGDDIPSNAIKPQKGYVFTGWKLNERKDTLMAQYKRKKILGSKPLIIAISVIGLCVIGFLAWKFIPKLFHRNEKTSMPNKTKQSLQANKDQSNNMSDVTSKNKDTTKIVNDDLKSNDNAEPKNSNSDKKSYGKTSGSLENEFLHLVRGNNVKMDAYKNLLNKYKGQNDPVIEYLIKICKDSKSFKQFSNLPDSVRMRAKSVSDLKK